MNIEVGKRRSEQNEYRSRKKEEQNRTKIEVGKRRSRTE